MNANRPMQGLVSGRRFPLQDDSSGFSVHLPEMIRILFVDGRLLMYAPEMDKPDRFSH